MPQDNLEGKVQIVTLRFEDGTIAQLIGRAFYDNEELSKKDLRFSPKNPIEIRPPRDLTDEIRDQIINNSQ